MYCASWCRCSCAHNQSTICKTNEYTWLEKNKKKKTHIVERRETEEEKKTTIFHQHTNRSQILETSRPNGEITHFSSTCVRQNLLITVVCVLLMHLTVFCVHCIHGTCFFFLSYLSLCWREMRISEFTPSMCACISVSFVLNTLRIWFFFMGFPFISLPLYSIELFFKPFLS